MVAARSAPWPNVDCTCNNQLAAMSALAVGVRTAHAENMLSCTGGRKLGGTVITSYSLFHVTFIQMLICVPCHTGFSRVPELNCALRLHRSQGSCVCSLPLGAVPAARAPRARARASVARRKEMSRGWPCARPAACAP